LRKALSRTSSRITRLLRRKDSAAADSVVANAAAKAVRLSAQLAEPPRLNKTNLHPYRLKVKELQNVLRMAETPSGFRFVEDLGVVKDAIGEWHDWEELVGIASKLLDHGGNCLLLAELKRTAGKQVRPRALPWAEIEKDLSPECPAERKGCRQHRYSTPARVGCDGRARGIKAQDEYP
jgi:CHAD domain-containing protein